MGNGEPVFRQMCLSVTLHPETNESHNRCLTSEPGCHASQTHPCAVHTAIYYHRTHEGDGFCEGSGPSASPQRDFDNRNGQSNFHPARNAKDKLGYGF